MYLLRKALLLGKTLSLRKLLNLARLYFSFHYSRWRGKPVLWGMPAKMGFEPTTSCNLRCPECPSGLRSFTRPTGMASMEIFRQSIDPLAPDLIYLLLYFQGEPFLHPNFLEMVRYARDRGIYTATSSNGHYLREEMCRRVIESGLSELIISIDGATQESYASYRIGGSLEKVITGVRNMVKARKEAKSRGPLILLQFLVVRPNEHEIEDILKLGKELGVDEVLLKTAQIYDYKNGNPLIPDNPRYSRYYRKSDGSYVLKNKLNNQCWRMWQGLEVTWDGRVLPCCFAKDGEHTMGMTGEENPVDIWKSERYQHFRSQLLSSRASIDICRNCSEGSRIWG